MAAKLTEMGEASTSLASPWRRERGAPSLAEVNASIPVAGSTWRKMAAFFGPGYLVLGPAVPALVDASQSARASLAGFAVARAWRNAPRPVEADDLLPERALAGDPLAKLTLVERIYRPLQSHSADLVTTLWSYLDNGRSLEATARELFVHPNTVRYRLKRVSDVIGWDATGPREALILQTALILGSIGTDSTRRRLPSLRRGNG